MSWKTILAGTALIAAAVPAQAQQFGGYGLSQVRATVTNYDKEIAFFKILGMKVGRLFHPGQQEMTWDKPGLGSSIIVTQKSATMTGTATQMLFFVPDMAATLKALKDGGFADVPEIKPATTPSIELQIKDADGNVMLVVAPNPNAPKK